MKRIEILIVLTLVILAIVASACIEKVGTASPANTPAPIPTATKALTAKPAPTATLAPILPLTLDALKNAEYLSEFAASGKAQLANGMFREKPVQGAAAETVIRLSEVTASGDLNGDGKEDAAVALIANTGGTGTFYTLAAVVNQNGKPKHAASAFLGDRVLLKSITIQSGVITVSLTKHGPSDPLCCPTLQATEKYKLQGDKLVKAE